MKIYKTRVDFEGVKTTHDLYIKIDEIVGGFCPKGYEFVEPDEIYILSSHKTYLVDPKYHSKEIEFEGFHSEIWFTNIIIDQYMEYFGSDTTVEDTRRSPYVIFQREETICKKIEQNGFMEHEINAFEGENVEVVFEGGLYIFDLDPVQYKVEVQQHGDWYKVVIKDLSLEEDENPLCIEDPYSMSAKELDSSDASDLAGVLDLLDRSESIVVPIKLKRTTVDLDDIDEFGNNNYIVEWSAASSNRFNVSYIEGMTRDNQLLEMRKQIAEDPLCFSLGDWKVEHKKNIECITEVLDILNTDYTQEFLNSVFEFNEKSKRYQAELRSELMNIEEVHSKSFDEEVHLNIDWKSLEATASKKEQIYRLAKNKISDTPIDGYECYIQIEIDGEQNCLIHENLVTDEILSTYPVDEYSRTYIDSYIDHPFMLVLANKHYLIVEVII